MRVPKPHFLVYSEVARRAERRDWRFQVRCAAGGDTFEAADLEPEIGGERLELLTVVRALEALDQPSQVTLFTDSSYVHEGLKHGLETWRATGWQWERGETSAPIRNRDLWQRVDRALQFHQVECQRQDCGNPSEFSIQIRQEQLKTSLCAAWRQVRQFGTTIARLCDRITGKLRSTCPSS